LAVKFLIQTFQVTISVLKKFVFYSLFVTGWTL